MQSRRPRIAPVLLAGALIAPLTATVLTTSGCDSRADAMKREVDREKGEQKEKEDIASAEVPPHPMRDKLMPVLEKIYPLNKPPGVVEAEIIAEGEFRYELTVGVLPIIRLPQGLSERDKVRAIVMATAEADAWAYRPKARREYADLVHRVGRGYGEDQKQAILKAYASLRLLQFFNSPDAQAAIDGLPAEAKGVVSEMRDHYVGSKENVWEEWMAVKMYARRVVAGYEPFRGVLRGIKKELGKEEPPPRTWAESLKDARFSQWGKEIEGNEELLIKLTNFRELREREEFMNDTHSLWVMQGSADVPEKAKKLKIDKAMGFAALREDLGGGYNDMTYVFPKKLTGPALKKAFIRSVIFGQLLHDFHMLSTAGSDWAERSPDNIIDSTTSVVPDEYDPLYAKCGSGAAADTFINHYASKHSFLAGLPSNKDSEGVIKSAHDCIVEGAAGKIYVPPKQEGKVRFDDEGPAPNSRLALFQMLARFENVDIAAMKQDRRVAEDDTIDEGEAILKKIKEQENAGKGIK